MDDLNGLQAREIGATPSGAIVQEELATTEGPSEATKTGLKKFIASLVSFALLAGVGIFALIKAPDSAGLIYGTFAGSLISALVAYTTGNVAEHRVLAGIQGIFQGSKK